MRSYTAKIARRSNPRQAVGRVTFFGKSVKKAKAALSRFLGNVKKKNVEQGFFDSTGFHPIRASSDYSGARAGEGRARSRVAKRTRVRSHEKRARRRRTAIS